MLTTVGDHVYAPLVGSQFKLLADIEILALRPERPGGIVTSGGDIDNRLKTLLDTFGVQRSVRAFSMTRPRRPSSRRPTRSWRTTV